MKARGETVRLPDTAKVLRLLQQAGRAGCRAVLFPFRGSEQEYETIRQLERAGVRVTCAGSTVTVRRTEQ